MRGASRGQVAIEFALVLGFLFALGLTAVQFAGVALATAKVNHAAQEAAYVAGSSLEAAGTSQTPCWAVSGGLAHPTGYSDAAICQTVLENLGQIDPTLIAVTVSPESLVQRGKRAPIHVTVTYRQPITSPLLRMFMGDTATITTTSSSWSN
ncbi:MAG: pilus assembly protein [Candidatus Dormibacteraeota bacterium]|nr:pilus assembly protein [Candidatus Dormibacteraeota bacterium]